MKKLGAGAIGLGALSMAPAAGRMKITDNDIFRNGDSMLSGIGGTNTMDTDLNMDGNSVNNAGSINAGNATIGHTPIKSETITLGDDEADSLSGTNGSIWMLVSDNAANGGHAIFIQRFNNIEIGVNNNVTDEGTTPLDGTSGPDGSINIASDNTTLWVENRGGEEIAFTLTEFGRS